MSTPPPPGTTAPGTTAPEPRPRADEPAPDAGPVEAVGRAEGAVAGVVGAGLALGLTELAAGLLDGVPSLVAAVAAAIVPVLPGGLVTWAIETFGESDRLLIGVGIVAVVLATGAVAGGMLRRRRPLEAATLFAGFALVGIVAATTDIATSLGVTVVATAVSAGLGWLAAWALVVGRRRGAVVATAQDPRIDAGRDAAIPPNSSTTSPPGEPATATGQPPASPPTSLEVARSDGRAPLPLDRRTFLAAAGAIGGAAAVAGMAGRVLARPAAVDPAAGEVAASLPTPQRVLPPPPAAASLDVDGISPLMVPNADFYRIDTALTGPPQVDLATWRLRIHGQVGRERTFSFTDLVDRGLVESDVTLTCVSNEVGGGLVGNARWTGVPLAPLLDEVGVLDGGTQLVGRAVDGFTVGFPTELARDGRDAMIAVAMNGEPLPVAHGFPVRLVVPGLYGYVSATKWLSEIELTGWDEFDAYWIQRSWAKEGPIKTQSRIDRPGSGSDVAVGTTTVAGVAWAPTRGIERVEVRVDDGDWQEADLAEALADTTWVQWQADVELEAGPHEVSVRATDGTGATQSPDRVAPHPAGAEGWHTVTLDAG